MQLFKKKSVYIFPDWLVSLLLFQRENNNNLGDKIIMKTKKENDIVRIHANRVSSKYYTIIKRNRKSE